MESQSKLTAQTRLLMAMAAITVVLSVGLAVVVAELVSSRNEAGDLTTRVARLEQIEQERQELAQRQEEQRRAQISQMAANATRVMSDPAADDQMKASAWRSLRMRAADWWTDAIVAEAVRIGTKSTDPQLRADIWRQAHANHTHPLLLEPLLHALANDPDRSAREEAAETLDLYLDRPGVREALLTASQEDADPGVRRQASTSLSNRDPTSNIGYDPAADPFKQLEEAQVQATADGKDILIIAGGDWCIWCHWLDAFLAENEDINEALKETFVVVKVYFGGMGSNEEFFATIPTAAGYPHFWVLDAEGELLVSQNTVALEDGDRSYDKGNFMAFIEEWKATL